MVRIRLTRLGAKKKPFYRLVATDQRSPRDGRFIEQLGWFDPVKTPKQMKLDLDRIDYWMSVGAQPTDTALALINKFRAQQSEAPAGSAS
jgi:small subunit ribosomal protein S16